MDDATSRELLNRYRNGDSDAAALIFDRYLERLLALARTRMSSKLKARIDPEDVVQSAYRSFFYGARNDRYVLRRAGDLWRLLAAITLNKLRGQIGYHTAQKRDIAAEGASHDGHEVIYLRELPIDEPTPEQSAAIFEELRLAMQQCQTTERAVLELRLRGETIEAIATEIGRSQRTVRRILLTVRERLEARLKALSG